jgi:hypothetical protein
MLTPAAEAGSWNPDATISTRNGQCKSRTRSSSASGSHARACLSQKNRGPPPNRWMSVYEAVTLPPCPHTKPNTTARNCKDGAYPAQTLSYVELMGFPEVLRISRDIPICGMITSRPQRSRAFLNPTQRPPTADQQPCPARPSQRGNRPTGHGRPILSSVAQDRSAEPVAPDRTGASRDRGLVHTGSARHRNPLVPGGHQRSRPASRNRRFRRPPPRRHRTAQQPGAGFEPLTPTAAAGLRPVPTRQVVTEDRPRPARQVAPQPRGLRAVWPRRPRQQHAISSSVA